MRTKYTPRFEQLWKKHWPGRWRDGNSPKKVGKADAYAVWRGIDRCNNGAQMDEEDREDAYKVLESGKVKNAGTQYLPDFCRWLKRRLWEDYL